MACSFFASPCDIIRAVFVAAGKQIVTAPGLNHFALKWIHNSSRKAGSHTKGKEACGNVFAEGQTKAYIRNTKTFFKDCKWFHLTGITPALGGNMVQICIEACKAAKEAGATVSCDLNYRGKLWTREEARKAMTEICKYVDVCISNEEDAKDVFGIEAENTDINGGKLNKEGYKSVAKQLADKFGFKKVAITLRTSINANRNNWAALLYDGKDYCFSKEYEMYIVDRVGGGLIYALLNGKSTQDAVEFAVAASCLKHTIEGDYNMVSVDEVEKLAGGNGSGRIQR